jgi:hypothetical protein
MICVGNGSLGWLTGFRARFCKVLARISFQGYELRCIEVLKRRRNYFHPRTRLLCCQADGSTKTGTWAVTVDILVVCTTLNPVFVVICFLLCMLIFGC